MTDQELDQMMRRALLDAAAQEAEALPQEPPELSPRRRDMWRRSGQMHLPPEM